MNRSLGEIDINPRIAGAVKRAGLTTAGSVINLSGAELSHLTGLTSGDVKQLVDVVSEAVVTSHPTTALEILKQGSKSEHFVNKLSTGCSVLDHHLKGGILTKGITEIFGESAAGKTQLCLQLCLSVQLPLEHGGLGSGAVYVCTEDTFPNKRFQQLVNCFIHSKCLSFNSKGMPNICFTDNVYIEHVAELDGLGLCVQKKLPLLLDRRRVRLVIIDSVAALFRCQYDSHNMVARAKHLASLATHLRKLAVQYKAAIVCVNQVTANVSGACDRDGSLRQSLPALGMAWADHVTCRLQLSRPQQALINLSLDDKGMKQERKVVEVCESMRTVRELEVVFAPHLPHVVIPLVITAGGVSCLR